MSDPTQNFRLSSLLPHYDIIAVRPTTEKAFLAACLSLQSFSIISLDLTVRHEFFFKPKSLSAALARGIKIEICYSQALSGSSEQRRNFISNVQSIVRATKGRGLVISSEAKKALGVRAPADVFNLMDIWGMGKDRAVQAVGENARSVVANEKMNRTGFRGVVDVVYGGEPIQAYTNDNGKKKKGKAQVTVSTDNGKTGEKRKVDEQSNVVPTISKTKAKKMRLEALKAEKEKASSE